MKVGFYQFRPVFGQIKRNVLKIIRALHDVEADLVVLPELALTGYYFSSRSELDSMAEDPTKSTSVESLIALCQQRQLHIVTGFAEKKGEHIYNSALLLGPDGILHIYRKLHLFNLEKEWFDQGNTPFSVQLVAGVRIGMMICFDWIFPEVTRTLSLLGAQIICHPSNLVLNYCQQAMMTRCTENMVFAVTANRYGLDRRPHGDLKFTGQSQIVAPRGVLIHRAKPQRDEMVVVEIDPTAADNKRITSANDVLGDRRPDFYAVR